MQAADHARRAGDRAQEVEAPAWTVATLGTTSVEDDLRRCRHVLTLVSDSPVLEAEIVTTMAVDLALQARFDDARAELARADALRKELAVPWNVANAAVSSGIVALPRRRSSCGRGRNPPRLRTVRDDGGGGGPFHYGGVARAGRPRAGA